MSCLYLETAWGAEYRSGFSVVDKWVPVYRRQRFVAQPTPDRLYWDVEKFEVNVQSHVSVGGPVHEYELMCQRQCACLSSLILYSNTILYSNMCRKFPLPQSPSPLHQQILGVSWITCFLFSSRCLCVPHGAWTAGLYWEPLKFFPLGGLQMKPNPFNFYSTSVFDQCWLRISEL